MPIIHYSQIKRVKRFGCLLVSTIGLSLIGTRISLAERPLIIRVTQPCKIRRIRGYGYLLQRSRATIAQPGDQLEQAGDGVKTLSGSMFIRLNDQGNELHLAPHTVLRIIKVEADATGGKRIYFAVEQGNIKVQLPSHIWPSDEQNDTLPRQLNGIRAMGHRRHIITEQNRIESQGQKHLAFAKY